MNESKTVRSQYKTFGPVLVDGYGPGAALWAFVRWDDQCGNGHNTFTITGEVRLLRHRDIAAGGCLHDEISKAFPELAPFLKWHLTSADGPMHYVANTVYLAGDRDYCGRAKGEPDAWSYVVRFGNSPISHAISKGFMVFLESRIQTGDFAVVEVAHKREPQTFGPKYTFAGYHDDEWSRCPFDSRREAEEWQQALAGVVCFEEIATSWSDGKERELDRARAAAVWPDATDEDLTAPGLKDRLLARLPALLAELRRDVESLGFTW